MSDAYSRYQRGNCWFLPVTVGILYGSSVFGGAMIFSVASSTLRFVSRSDGTTRTRPGSSDLNNSVVAVAGKTLERS